MNCGSRKVIQNGREGISVYFINKENIFKYLRLFNKHTPQITKAVSKYI